MKLEDERSNLDCSFIMLPIPPANTDETSSTEASKFWKGLRVSSGVHSSMVGGGGGGMTHHRGMMKSASTRSAGEGQWLGQERLETVQGGSDIWIWFLKDK